MIALIIVQLLLSPVQARSIKEICQIKEQFSFDSKTGNINRIPVHNCENTKKMQDNKPEDYETLAKDVFNTTYSDVSQKFSELEKNYPKPEDRHKNAAQYTKDLMEVISMTTEGQSVLKCILDASKNDGIANKLNFYMYTDINAPLMMASPGYDIQGNNIIQYQMSAKIGNSPPHTLDYTEKLDPSNNKELSGKVHISSSFPPMTSVSILTHELRHICNGTTHYPGDNFEKENLRLKKEKVMKEYMELVALSKTQEVEKEKIELAKKKAIQISAKDTEYAMRPDIAQKKAVDEMLAFQTSANSFKELALMTNGKNCHETVNSIVYAKISGSREDVTYAQMHEFYERIDDDPDSFARFIIERYTNPTLGAVAKDEKDQKRIDDALKKHRTLYYQVDPQTQELKKDSNGEFIFRKDFKERLKKVFPRSQ